jgi:hypothetical protein
MELPGDEAQVEAHFGPFGDGVSKMISVHSLRRTFQRVKNHFRRI